MWENTEGGQQIERKIKGEVSRKLEQLKINKLTADPVTQKWNKN